ncbi:MAG: IPT/TIG domain-containing protein [Polyangiaceae bacterium]|nr:IPT/TIG domain-containing protein [Polyangiaceae bacterium]
MQPVAGPSSGDDLVRLVGTGFAEGVQVLFGGVPAGVISVRDEAGLRIVDARTPPHLPGSVDVELTNLDEAGTPVPGESVVVSSAYRFTRSTVAREADLTRAVRQLLRELKRQVLANVSATVSVDYDDTVVDGLNVIAMAKVPSLVLSGPTLRPNRFYSANVAHEDVVDGVSGPELLRRRPPYTADLVFTLTAAADAARGVGRWELDADGEFHITLAGKDDVRAFTCGFVVRGFDVDERMPLDLGKPVTELELETRAIAPGGAP